MIYSVFSLQDDASILFHLYHKSIEKKLNEFQKCTTYSNYGISMKRDGNLILVNLEEYNNIRHDFIDKYKALNHKVKQSLGTF